MKSMYMCVCVYVWHVYMYGICMHMCEGGGGGAPNPAAGRAPLQTRANPGDGPPHGCTRVHACDVISMLSTRGFTHTHAPVL